MMAVGGDAQNVWLVMAIIWRSIGYLLMEKKKKT
jgi:hypothetical protein